MIGGPNQSHKVNFKEPLPARGKISKRTFVICFVNPFPDFCEKSFVKEHYFLRPFVYRTRVFRKRFTEGIAEDGNCIFLIKTFLNKFSNTSASIYNVVCYDALKSLFHLEKSFVKNPNIENREPQSYVSSLLILMSHIPGKLPVLCHRVQHSLNDGTDVTPINHPRPLSLPRSGASRTRQNTP